MKEKDYYVTYSSIPKIRNIPKQERKILYIQLLTELSEGKKQKNAVADIYVVSNKEKSATDVN